jgi:hypothetical protein
VDVVYKGLMAAASYPGGAVKEEEPMPLVSVFNLRREDRLSELEEVTRRALTSMPELAINDYEIDVVPVLRPDDFDGEVTRINVDLWERAERTKEALQELATRLAKAFQAVAGEDRRVKVVIRPYDLDRSGWVSRYGPEMGTSQVPTGAAHVIVGRRREERAAEGGDRRACGGGLISEVKRCAHTPLARAARFRRRSGEPLRRPTDAANLQVSRVIGVSDPYRLNSGMI